MTEAAAACSQLPELEAAAAAASSRREDQAAATPVEGSRQWAWGGVAAVGGMAAAGRSLRRVRATEAAVAGSQLLEPAAAAVVAGSHREGGRVGASDVP